MAFLIVAVFIHDVTAAKWHRLSLAGISIAVVASDILAVDYGLQLSVLQPSLFAGASSGLTLLFQHNPHGVFTGLENLGYGTLALAFVFVGTPRTSAPSRIARSGDWSLVLGGRVH